MAVIREVRLAIDTRSEAWTDTGVSVAPGQVLNVTASGQVRWKREPGGIAYPEGYYPDNLEHPEQDLGLVRTTLADDAHATNVPSLSLVLVFRDYGNGPSPTGNIDDAVKTNRSNTITGRTGRVYVIFNDFVGTHGDNSGQFDLVLQVATEESQPIPVGQVSPIRFIPNTLLAQKKGSVCRSVYCAYVKPITGEPEFYACWDKPVECPEYHEQTGSDAEGGPLYSTTPAGTYQPYSGVSITGIPTSIKLGVEAPDITLVKFDRGKVRRGYYQGAHCEIFEVALDDTGERWVHLVGTLGNTDMETIPATIELTPYSELLNIPRGRRIQPFCDVGRIPGETFGRGRCRNVIALDGIDIADWTRGAEVASVLSLSKMTLDPAAVGEFEGFEDDFPGSHGIVRVQTGLNTGVVRDVQTFDAATGTIVLRTALPDTPAAGDTLLLEAGCDKLINGTQGCLFWNNVKNFRGKNRVPGRDGVRRRYEG